MKKIMTACVAITCAALTLYAQDTMKKTPDAKTAKSATHASRKMQKPNSSKDSAKKSAYTPGEMTWSDAPPIIPAGAKMAVLDGNPMADELYTLRLKLPAGYKVGPHWHPKREEVTIISGALNVGMGDKFDAAKMKTYPGGSFFYMDPDMHHYVQTKSATELQIHGRGPVQFNYIDPNDDPTKSAAKK